MKKLFLSSLLATSVFAFAYTQIDVSNAKYLADNNIITKQSDATKYRLDSTITRAEVVAIALKIKGIQDPASYKCKKYFSDTVQNDWICRAVEMAADNGLVSRGNTKFRPQERITRVETLAILLKAGGIKLGKYFPNDPEQNIYLDVNHGTWQSDITNGAFGLGIIGEGICDAKCVIPFGGGVPQGKFYPNRNATRAEVFRFTRNILEYKVNELYLTDSGVLGIENGNVVFVQNGKKNFLTQDAIQYGHKPCLAGEQTVSYELLGTSGTTTLIKQNYGLCDADGGSHYLIFDKNNIQIFSFGEILQDKFQVLLNQGWATKSVEIQDGKIVIKGEYSSTICNDSPECPTYIPSNIIKKFDVKITPSFGGPTDFEWTLPIPQLF